MLIRLLSFIAAIGALTCWMSFSGDVGVRGSFNSKHLSQHNFLERLPQGKIDEVSPKSDEDWIRANIAQVIGGIRMDEGAQAAMLVSFAGVPLDSMVGYRFKEGQRDWAATAQMIAGLDVGVKARAADDAIYDDLHEQALILIEMINDALDRQIAEAGKPGSSLEISQPGQQSPTLLPRP